ncbi:hypothetical protein GCM10023196_008700 [Actinoallomurus vinaceus]|uniref:Uncharacterized protein n=1 Tax=Actinoallomurus vinaceus TaxID=1080074 RepID=A0ABP8U397_9ACTN
MSESLPHADDDIHSYVATCPITPEFARRIVGLMDLPWDDPAVADRAMLGLGWSDEGEVPMDECRFVTDLGHFVHGDDCLYLPFAHFYDVGGELWPEDGWGTQPGWSSRKDAGRADFDACVDTAVGRFTEVLGPPGADVRTEGGTVSTGPYCWRYAAWRRSGNVLVVGQTLEPISYGQDEEAVVFIRDLPEGTPLPDAAAFPGFLTW